MTKADLIKAKTIFSAILIDVRRGLAVLGATARPVVVRSVSKSGQVLSKRPPRFETGIAIGTFAFIVLVAAAGFVMLGGSHR